MNDRLTWNQPSWRQELLGFTFEPKRRKNKQWREILFKEHKRGCWVTRCSWSTADISTSALQFCWNYLSRVDFFFFSDSEKVLHKSASLRSTLPNSLEELSRCWKPVAGHRSSQEEISWLVPQNNWGWKLKDFVWILLPDVAEIHCVPQYLDFCASVLVSLYLRPRGRV